MFSESDFEVMIADGRSGVEAHFGNLLKPTLEVIQMACFA